MITLFDDQARSIQRLRDSMRRHKSVLLQGETGSGKSVMAAYMIASSRAKNLKSAFVVPRRDLLHQMSMTFTGFDISHSFVAAGKPFNPYSPTHICTVGTLDKRKERIQPNIIFFDETHYGDAQLSRLIMHYRAQGCWVVGLSATPGEGLDAYYDDLVLGPTIRELIDLKRLSDYELFAPDRPDLSKVKTSGGDYAKSELASFMEHQDVLVGNAVKHYQQHAMGRLNITFCTSIKHSEMTAEKFRDAGVPSIHIDGETPEDVRQQVAKAFARRELLNICSVDLMTFGYDLAAASGIKTAVIESISDLRPTKSLALQRQKNGRALRYKDFPALIFDHSGNYREHGRPCEEIAWSLKSGDLDGNGKGGARVVPVRSCSNCYFVHPPRATCPGCGYEYPVDYRMLDEIEGELKKVDVAAIAAQNKKKEQGRARSIEDLIALGKQRGMKDPAGWARHVFGARDKKPVSVSLHMGNKELEL